MLSFGIPFAPTPLVMLTSRRRVMGEFVNRQLTTVAATIIVALIVILNIYLLYITLAH